MTDTTEHRAISIQDLLHIDAAEFVGLDRRAIEKHFRLRALRAKPGQLRVTLGRPLGGLDDGVSETSDLIEEFVRSQTRRTLEAVEIILDIRSLGCRRASA